jgi:DNA-binding transcriptional LysR family regulator
VKERLSKDIVKAVSGGLEDIGIISDAVDAGAMQLRPFAIDRLVVVVPLGHPLAEAKHVAFRDIVQDEFVGLTAGAALQEHISEHAANLGHPLSFRVRVRTFEGICRMVAHNVGIGIVPKTAARRCRRPTAFRSVLLIDEWATRRLSLCFRALEELPPIARDLVEHLSTLAAADRSLS